MPVALQPIRQFKCTYADCPASFETLDAMRRHKRGVEEHDYCHKCDEDFKSYEDLAMHKAFRPDNHGKACRVCGEEFKSASGLRRHIEMNHKVDQKLACVGCGETFYRGSLLIEHIEFGNCENISPAQFEGYIVHKHLIKLYLEDEDAHQRFQKKIGMYDATQDDDDEEGGISVSMSHLDSDFDSSFDTPAIEPEVEELSPEVILRSQPYPPLPSTKADDASATLVSDMSRMSVTADTNSVTGGSTFGGASVTSSKRTAKVWNSNNSAAARLFPDAKPTSAPVLPAATTIKEYNHQENKNLGNNLMRTRFWDPTSQDWNPEQFVDSVTNTYSCPFDCAQKFDIPADLNRHIMSAHRITKMRCPSCLANFKSCTALVAHCESRGAKCQINKAEDYNTFLDRLTGGFLGVEELVRPEFEHNPVVLVKNSETGKMEEYKPPSATYLQYVATTPSDWKPMKEIAYQLGGGQKNVMGWRK